MCFTIEVHLTRKAIENRFQVNSSALYDFDFNYFYKAFSNPLIPVISMEKPDQVELMEWGLIPAWVKDKINAEQIRKGTYNARAESLHVKPSFREPFRNGRCLVIAHGFFEWQLADGLRIPWYIRLKNNEPFVFAGLFDSWRDPEGKDQLQTFSIVTTSANPLMEKIHNTKKRMPVILPREFEKDWISEDISLQKAKRLLIPLDETLIHAHPVSQLISRKHSNPLDPELVKPFSHPISGSLF